MPGADLILFAVLAALLVFMFWNSRKRMQKMKAEQEEKRRQTVAGAKVLLQGGLYGTIVTFDPEDLDRPVEVELAPGVVVEVHSQAIIRVVDPTDDLEDEDALDESAEGELDEGELDAAERDQFEAIERQLRAEPVADQSAADATDATVDPAVDTSVDKDKPQA